ncbi:MAG: TonB-dependent receptor [Rhodospirillales bacterium]|jgi:iron complex outermembrane receptor protein|nr:TonB-dependent receptor [Rhodospirillales bacterium]
MRLKSTTAAGAVLLAMVQLAVAGNAPARIHTISGLHAARSASSAAAVLPARQQIKGAAKPATAPAQGINPFTGQQNVPQSPPPPASKLQEVVVTATGTNIAGIAPVGTEAITINRQELDSTGLTSLNQVMQNLPQVSNSAPAGVANYRQGGTSGYGSSFGGANPAQGSAINLRGLGAGATLVLVDGHRVTPTGTAGVYTNADQLPLAAVQSIQIIANGNSAIYGSDAVGGVVNYIIRKNFNGVQVSPRATWANGYTSQGVSVVGGHTWRHLGSLGRGNFMIAFGYEHRSPMLDSSSPYLSDNLIPFGGVNNEIRGSSLTTGAINGGVGPGQPGEPGNASGGAGPIASPGALSNVGWCDNYNPFGACTGYLYRGLPAGNTGVPTYGQTLAQPSLADRSLENQYLGRQWRYQVALFYNQQINSRLSAFFEGLWTKSDVYTNQSQYQSDQPPVVTVNPGSPYYIAPPSPAGGPMTIDLSPTALGIPLYGTNNPDTNWTAIAGLKAHLWGDWLANLSMSVGRDITCGECQVNDQLDVGALQYYVDTGAINPLTTTRLTPAQLAMFMGTNVQWSHMGMEDFVLKFNGTVFKLPAGPFKMAFGTEVLHQTESIANGASRTDEPAYGIYESSALPPVGYEGVGCAAPLACPPRTRPDQFAWDNIVGKSRLVGSFFTEFYVPVIGPQQHVPLVRSLRMDAAVRYDHYSDFGGTTNPQISLTWVTSRALRFNGSWGTSYRAPSLVDLNPFVFSVKTYIPGFPTNTGNPAIPQFANVGYVFGDQSNLKPETAKTWSLGFDLTPRQTPGLDVSSTFYDINYSNEIFGPPLFPEALLNPADYQLYKSYIHPVSNPANCSASNPDYAPGMQPFLNAVGIYGIVTPAELCTTNLWIDGRTTNIGSMTEQGVDMDVKYHKETPFGLWLLELNATKVVTEKLALAPTAPQTSILGQMANGGVVPWRGRATLGWNKGPWSATLFCNYVGTYENDEPLPGRPNTQVASWTTFDLDLGFDFGAIYQSGFMQNTRVSLSAQNLFDRTPPLVLTAGGAAFDGNNANVFGRIITLQLTMGL